MSCHFCDITALGCSGCDTNHIGLTPLHYGLGSPLLSSKTFLHEFNLQFSAAVLADDSPYRPKIDKSLANGTLGKYGRCRLSAAIQIVAAELSQNLGPEIQQRVEKILDDDEADREKTRKAAKEAAEEATRELVRKIAKEEATKVATEVATALAEIEKVKKRIVLKNPKPLAGSLDGAPKQIDDYFFPLDLPFAVTLYGHSSTKVYVSDNGILSLDEGLDHDSALQWKDGQPLPFHPPPPKGFPPYSLFPFWADLMILQNKSHGIFYEIVGEIGARSLTVEWNVTSYDKQDQYFHFGLSLEEIRPNVVTFKYYDMADISSKCTIGVQGRGPNDYQIFPHEKKVSPGLQIVFDTETNTMSESIFPVE